MASLNFGTHERKVETKNLYIKDNIIRWSDTVLQISNVSMISTANVRGKPFPILAAVLVLLGVVIGSIANQWGSSGSSGMGILITTGGIVWIVVWAIQNENAKTITALNISMNSGDVFTVIFHDKQFLQEVISRMTNLINKPAEERNLTINIKDNTFHDGSSVFGGFIDNSTKNIYINDIENARRATTDERILEALDQLLTAVKKNDKPSIAKVVTDFAVQFGSGLFLSVASAPLVEFVRSFMR